MRLAHILIPTSVILSGILGFGVAFLPNFLGPFGTTKQYLRRNRRLRKNRAVKIDGQLFVLHADDFDHTLIPEIEYQTGMKTVSMYDFQLGKSKADNYREPIIKSSVTLVILTKDLLHEPWLRYAMAFCFQKDPSSVLLWREEGIHCEQFPRFVQDALAVGCTAMPFNSENLKNPGVLHQLVKDTAQNIVNHHVNGCGVPHGLTPIGLEDVFKFETFVVHDLDFDPCDQVMNMAGETNELKIISSADSRSKLGTYIYETCSDAIRSSGKIIFKLTPQLLKDPYFNYQLHLALHHKGHRSITFVLTQNCLTSLPDSRAMRYAIAACRKIY